MLSGLRGKLDIVAGAKARQPAAPASSDCLVLRADYPTDAGALKADARAVTAMCGEAGADFDINEALFLDTETTGLSSAGTVAFLTGLGWIEGGRFVVEQYFLRDYSEEPFMLEKIAQRLAGRRHMVTFNGRTFDCPLLEGRFTLLRMRPLWRQLDQIDLIYPARRVWKLRLEKCSLGELERQVLGVARQGDIPGAQVPEKYFEYLKTRDFSQMEGVIEHNRQDIVTLMTLLGALAGLYRAPLLAEHPEDIFSLGRAFERGGDGETALACFRATAHGAVAARASGSMSMLLKRRQELREAMDVWRDMESRGLGGLMPYIELSKAYEHRLGDLRAALDEVERAQSYARAIKDAQALGELEHRRARLISKLSNKEEK